MEGAGLEAKMDHFWQRVHAKRSFLGPSWGHLGPSWGRLGAILGHLGAILGRLGAILALRWVR